MGLSMAYAEDGEPFAMYFPFRHPVPKTGDENYGPEILAEVRKVIEGAKAVVFHHAKFDLVSLRTLGINYEGMFYDTMLIANLISEVWPREKSLNSLSKYYLGPQYVKDMPAWLKGLINLTGWHSIYPRQMYQYGATDAALTLKLIMVLWPMFLQEATEETWEHKQKLVRTIIRMERHGVKVDVNKCVTYQKRGASAMAEAQEAVGFNPASSKDKEAYFIDGLGLPVLKRSATTGKPSFDKSVMPEYEKMLEHVSGEHAESVRHVLDYLGWQKAVSSFYGPWVTLMDDDGRLRTNYIMHKDPNDGGTTTGRLSSKEPNLQQIPKMGSKPWNDSLKTCLIPERGYVLVEADYSQLELRLGTAYAGEASLMQVFNEDRDIFTEMSQQLGLTRDATKTFVYSTQYGAGVNRISNVFRISKQEAMDMRSNYFARYPGFHDFSKRAQATVAATGRIRIWSGRHRHFADSEGESHKAMNACIQGGAADVVERIMVKCDETFVDDTNCRMLLQVHDALIFEIKKDLLDEYLPKIKETMESVNEIFDFGVKFAVDGHVLGTKERLI